ncbi:MAG: DUF58 domain-containing protein [Anaerolineales bacterium]
MDPRRWLPLMGVLIILGILFKVPLLAALPTMLGVVIGVANWWKNRALDNVVYRRRPYYRRAFPGEEVPLKIEVENRKLLPLSWLRVQDPWPKAVGPDDEDLLAPTHLPTEGILTNVFSLRWFERARRTYNLKFRKRGVYTVGPVRLQSGDLFGMYEDIKDVGPVEKLTVFPALLPFRDLELPAENPFGDIRSRRRMFEDPNRPMGVREYHPEDEFRRVHWPATAHTGELKVKVYQPTSAQVMVVCMNVSTFSRHWEGTYPALLEHIVQAAATLVHQGVEDGYSVGLISNGCLSNADQPFRIPPGRSPRQLAHLLEALAGATPVVTAPFERYLIKEIPRVPFGATLVIVTAITKPELGEALVSLKQHGRKITLISFAKAPPPEIPRVRAIHLPFKE